MEPDTSPNEMDAKGIHHLGMISVVFDILGIGELT